MDQDFLEKYFYDLTSQLESEVNKNIENNQMEKDDIFKNMKRMLFMLQDEMARRFSFDLESVYMYVEQAERKAQDRNIEFIQGGFSEIRRFVEDNLSTTLDSDDVKTMTLKISEKMQEALIEKEAKSMDYNGSNRMHENGFFIEFTENIGQYMNKLGTMVLNNDASFYDDIHSYIKRITEYSEELVMLEANSQTKLIKEIEIITEEALKSLEQRQEQAQEQQEEKSESKELSKELEIPDEIKQEMMEKFRNGEFQQKEVNGKNLIYVSVHDEDEQGRVLKRGVLSSERAFNAMYNADSLAGVTIITIQGKYYDIVETLDEFEKTLNQEQDKKEDRKQNKEEEEKQQIETSITRNIESSEDKLPISKEELLNRFIGGKLDFSDGLISSAELKESVVDPETKEVKQKGIRISQRLFVDIFNNRAKLAVKDYGHTICYMNQDELERLEEFEKKKRTKDVEKTKFNLQSLDENNNDVDSDEWEH